jgi:hypothetical protein
MYWLFLQGGRVVVSLHNRSLVETRRNRGHRNLETGETGGRTGRFLPRKPSAFSRQHWAKAKSKPAGFANLRLQYRVLYYMI